MVVSQLLSRAWVITTVIARLFYLGCSRLFCYNMRGCGCGVAVLRCCGVVVAVAVAVAVTYLQQHHGQLLQPEESGAIVVRVDVHVIQPLVDDLNEQMHKETHA